MKEKINKVSKTIISLVIALSLALVSLIGLTIAYFTDSKSYSGTLNFGDVKLKVTKSVDGSDVEMTDGGKIPFTYTNSTNLMPGDTVTINFKVSLQDDCEPTYYLVSLTDTKGVFGTNMYFSDGTKTDDVLNVYVNDGTKTYLQSDSSQTAVTDKYVGILAKDSTHSFSISITNSLTEDTSVTLSIYAMQMANVDANNTTDITKSAYNQLAIYTNFIPNYTEVEYLENTGTQYINTGINISSTVTDWNVEMSIMWTDTSTRQLMGYSPVYRGYFGVSSNGEYELGSEGTGIVASETDYDNIVWGLKSDKYSINVNGTEWTTGKDEKVGEVELFALLGKYNCKTKMKYCKISIDGVLVRNFVPCVRNSDGVAGMWDKVEQKFYTNAGTGTFSTGS